jgi:hypothetical protein
MNGPALPIAMAIDLEHYPITPLASAEAQALAHARHAQLAATGACLLPERLSDTKPGTMSSERLKLARLRPHRAARVKRGRQTLIPDDP